MSNNPPVWKCANCKNIFTSTKREQPINPQTPETAAKLREDWLKAVELLEQNPGIESYERKELRTSLAYFGTKSSNVWLVPDELITVRPSKGGGFALMCQSCANSMKMYYYGHRV